MTREDQDDDSEPFMKSLRRIMGNHGMKVQYPIKDMGTHRFYQVMLSGNFR